MQVSRPTCQILYEVVNRTVWLCVRCLVGLLRAGYHSGIVSGFHLEVIWVEYLPARFPAILTDICSLA